MSSVSVFYKECGWGSLANRRYFQKMCFMYKRSNNLVSDYVFDIIPPRVAEVSNYPLRNRDNIPNPYNRTETVRRSCIPSSVTQLNIWQAVLLFIVQNRYLIYIISDILYRI